MPPALGHSSEYSSLLVQAVKHIYKYINGDVGRQELIIINIVTIQVHISLWKAEISHASLMRRGGS